MIRQPPRSTLLSLHDALPICGGAGRDDRLDARRLPREAREVHRDAREFRVDGRPARARVDPPRAEAPAEARAAREGRSEEHTSELQSRQYLACRLLLENI